MPRLLMKMYGSLKLALAEQQLWQRARVTTQRYWPIIWLNVQPSCDVHITTEVQNRSSQSLIQQCAAVLPFKAPLRLNAA
eukprot:18848-Heterococcus_DN1.PRE.2